MTKQKKEKQIEAAKARIANKAVVFATVASALSPTANAPTAPENATNNQPTPIAQTVTASPDTALDMSSEEAAKQPGFGSKEWLKEQITADREEHDTAVAEQTAKLTAENNAENSEDEYTPYSKEFDEVYAEKNNQPLEIFNLIRKYTTEAYAEPCQHEKINTGRVGNWSWNYLSPYDMAYAQTNQTMKETPQDQPDKFVDHSKIRTVKKIKSMANAWYNYEILSQMITLQTYSEAEQQLAAQNIKKYGTNKSYEYITNNVTARNAVFYHELNHLIDDQYNGRFLLLKMPLNAAKSDQLTETKSYAVEYLATAQQYTVMKQQGIDIIQVNGEDRPLESILEMYPGLKEVIEEKGFDVNDPQSVRNVVQVASDHWHKKFQSAYMEQRMNSAAYASKIFAAFPMSEQLEILRNEDAEYQDVSERMLQNTYIGQNTIVNLSGCRDLLDTFDKDEFVRNVQLRQENDTDSYEDAFNQIDLISYEELQAVNTYLESKGFTTDNNKQFYMSSALKKIFLRSENQDDELKKILHSHNNSTMAYADGLNERTFQSMRIIGRDGKMYPVSDAMLAQAQERIKQRDQDNPNALPGFEKMPEISLVTPDREPITSEMKQDRQDHESKLNTQIDALTRPVLPSQQKAEEEKQPANQTIAPTVMVNMPQNSR